MTPRDALAAVRLIAGIPRFLRRPPVDLAEREGLEATLLALYREGVYDT